MGVEPKSTMFGLTLDQVNTGRMFCATSAGEVWGSTDGGDSWTAHPLPEGANQVYALACG